MATIQKHNDSRYLLTLLTLLFFMITSINASANQDKPNILFIMADDLRCELGVYGVPVCKTPNLDRLAKEGVTFMRMYCQYPVCGPSRASLMSGLYPNTTKMLRNNYAAGAFRKSNQKLADHPSMSQFFIKQGYNVTRVSKIYHMGVPGGIERGDAGGDDPQSWMKTHNIKAPETQSPGQLELLSPKRKHYGSNFARVIVPNDKTETQADEQAARIGVSLIKQYKNSDKPFFLAVGFVRPHVPLVAPKRIFDLYPAKKMQLPKVAINDFDDVPDPAQGMENERRYGMNQLQQQQSVAGYYASVTYMDEQVGRLLNALDETGQRKNTIVVFASDHGYNLGEHHSWQKLSLWEDSVRVPFIISAPEHKATAGQKTHGVTQLIDLYPTLLDLAGYADQKPDRLQGRSLVGLLKNPENKAWDDAFAYTVTYRGGESIRTDRYRYNRWGNGAEELYDHQIDPEEFWNKAEVKEYEAVLNQMRTQLNQIRASTKAAAQQ